MKKFSNNRSRSDIAKEIFKWFSVLGITTVALLAPNAVGSIVRLFNKNGKYPKKEIYDTFYRLQKEKCILIRKRGDKVYGKLSEKGWSRAFKYQIRDLRIKKPLKWDGKWRVLIFDISTDKHYKRDILRGFLKRLSFYQLQKSVWVFPYECREEVKLLREFLKLAEDEVRLIVAQDIGGSKQIKKNFGLSTSKLGV